MTIYGEILEKLKPLERSQYTGLLKHIRMDGTIFGQYYFGKWKPKDLGLTLGQLKTAMNRLADSGLITIEESSGEVEATLTNNGRKMIKAIEDDDNTK